jgi:transcription antitermination factor NusG
MDRNERAGFAKGRVGVAAMRWALGAGKAALAGAAARRRESVAELPVYPRWAVARVFAGQEFRVADDLTASGDFYGYAPHRVVAHPRARVSRPFPSAKEARKPVERDYAVFAGYVFVGCSEGVWLGRHSHRDILDVLGDALGRPGVSQAAMAALNRLHVVGALHRAAAPPVTKGEVVEFDLGGGDVRGVVTELTRAGVKVDVSMFGRLTPVDVGLDSLKRVAL